MHTNPSRLKIKSSATTAVCNAATSPASRSMRGGAVGQERRAGIVAQDGSGALRGAWAFARGRQVAQKRLSLNQRVSLLDAHGTSPGGRWSAANRSGPGGSSAATALASE